MHPSGGEVMQIDRHDLGTSSPGIALRVASRLAQARKTDGRGGFGR